MGLDVYLYQYRDSDPDAILKLLWFSEEPWAFEAFHKWAATPPSERGSFPSEKDRAESREKLSAKARELGLPESVVTNDHFGGIYVSFPSKRHPQWQVGDWYNLSITRAIMKHFADTDLKSVFPETNEGRRYFRPDWSAAKMKLSTILRKLEKLEPSEIDRFISGLSKTFARHLHQIEVMIETMDYVLGSENPKQFILLWSD